MTSAKTPAPDKGKVGDLIELPEACQVSRPNGDTLTVSDGLYYLDAPGVHTVYDGTEGGRRIAVS